MQLAQLLSQRNEDAPGVEKKYDLAAVKELIEEIPFELSDDQKKVVNEIFADLHSKKTNAKTTAGRCG